MLTKGHRMYLPPIVGIRREQSIVFFPRSATMLSFETPGGSHRPPPPPGRVMENALPGRGLRAGKYFLSRISNPLGFLVRRGGNIYLPTHYGESGSDRH